MSKIKDLAKNTLCFLLVLVLSASTLSMLSATSTSAVSAECSNITYNKVLYDKYQSVCERLVQGMESFEKEIYVGDFNLPKSDTAYIIKTVIRKHPELFYIDTSKYVLGSDGDKIMVICPIYLFDEQTVEEKRNLFEAEVQKYLAKIDSSMTDFEKATILHDELVLNCSYLDEDGTGHISAYEAIVNKKANCQGYSEAYSYLLARVGVKSEIVESSAMYHIWNKVCIDGVYYNVDLTWNDPMPDKKGHVGHKYFLLSDEALCNGNSEIASHYGFDYAYYKSTDTKYDNCKFRYIDTKMCFVNGECYFVDNTYNSQYEKCLLNYDYKTDAVELVKRFDYKWMSGETSYWRGGYMSLDECDGLLYYNSPDSSYVYDVQNNEFTEFSTEANLSKPCYGLRIDDNKVYAVVSENPNTEGTLVYLGECIKKTSIIVGDVNGDGCISVVDATQIQKYCADIIEFSDEELIVADFDNNGTVNIMDATAIQKAIVK